MATTTEVMKPAAADKVFNTFELLEKILIEVLVIPPTARLTDRLRKVKAIYRLQRVNSIFRDVIHRSKALREGTYQARGGDKGHDSAHSDSFSQWLSIGTCDVNPFTDKFDRLLSLPAFQMSYCGINLGALTSFFDVETHLSIDESRFSMASWRNMFFARDQSVRHIVHVNACCRYRTSGHRSIELGGGITLGNVADEVVKAVKMAEEADREKFQKWV